MEGADFLFLTKRRETHRRQKRVIVEYNIAKENTGVADGDFLQKCMLDVVEQKVELLILTYSGK